MYPNRDDTFMAIAIDDACTAIHRAWREDRVPVSISLSPALYAQVLGSRDREARTGAPLLLLDLLVVEDSTLAGSAVIVASVKNAG